MKFFLKTGDKEVEIKPGDKFSWEKDDKGEFEDMRKYGILELRFFIEDAVPKVYIHYMKHHEEGKEEIERTINQDLIDPELKFQITDQAIDLINKIESLDKV